MPNLPIMSFNGGEFTPLIDCRSDVEKYSSGCRHLENFIPRIYGAAERRPGTKYISSQYNSSNSAIRMSPFIFSSDTAYAGEFGNLYARYFDSVFYEGEQVYYNGNEVTYYTQPITTPYIENDLFQLKTKQVGDVMWITHPGYAQEKLSRTSPTTFSINPIVFNKGPFLLRNDLINPDITNTAYMVMATSSVMSYELGGSFDHAYGTRILSEVFTPVDTLHVNTCSLYLYRHGISSSSLATISIRATTRNASIYYPTGSDLVSQTFDAYLLPADPANPNTGSVWQQVTFSSTITLYAGVSYAIVLTYSAGDTSNYVGWVDNVFSTPYDCDIRNCFAVSTNGGTSWGTGELYYGGNYYEGASRMEFRLGGTVDVSGSVQYSGTLTCQDVNAVAIPYFENSQIGALYKLTFPRVTKVSKGYYLPGYTLPYTICAPIDVKGSFHVGTSGTWNATVELQRNENGAGWETVEVWVGENNFNAAYSAVENADNVQYQMLVTDFTSESPRLRASITVNNPTQDTIVRITALVSSSVADILIINGSIVASPTKRWAEGAWSLKRGYPTSVTFYEDRCVYTGMSPIQTQVAPGYISTLFEPKELRVWLSHTGDYENFEEGVTDADSFSLSIPSTNDVVWIEALESLVLGTDGDEWMIHSNKMEQPITPTNFSVRQQSSYGSENLQPIQINEQMLFVEKAGEKVREITYNGDKYVCMDLTSLAEHITKSGVVALDVQSRPDSIVWCVLDDGSLICMVYEKIEKVVAWAKMPITGTVLSVCVIPGVIEDEIWIAIKRTGGIFVEKFAPRAFDAISDAYYVDAGITYSGTSTTTISGLSYLDGQTVKVLGNGVVFDDAIPATPTSDPVYWENQPVFYENDIVYYITFGTSGVITTTLAGVTTAVTKAQVGLAFTSKLQPMRISTSIRGEGHTQGVITRVPRMSVSFLNTLNAQYGASDSNLFDINWTDAKWENSADSISGLFTGEVTVSINGGFSVQNPIIISTDDPLPCIVRSMMPRLDVTGN